MELRARILERAPVLGRREVWIWVASLALVPLTWHRVWQRPPFLPIDDFDASWQAALHMAAHQRLSFGGELVFPYGPLGFLALPVLYFTSTAALAFVFVSLGRLVLTALVLRASLRAFPWPVAVVLAYVVGTLPIWDTDLALVVLLFWTLAALERPDFVGAGVLLGLAGPLVAFQLLVKTNVGVVAAVVAFVAVIALPSNTVLLARAWLPVSFAGTFVVLWAAAGGALGDIGSWARSGVAFVQGYSQGLALEAPGLHWNYAVAAAMLALLAYVVWSHAAALPPGRRAAVILIGLAFAFGYFKEGFVRHDVHATFFFGAISTAAVAFARRAFSRWAALAVVALGVAGVVRTAHLSAGYFDPIPSIRAYQFEARTFVQPGRRRVLVARSKADVRRSLALDPGTLRLLEGHTVHVDPYATTAVWAYGLDWRPLPVFQENVVDTPYLDGRNARFLASGRAPERILREHVPTVDGEAPELEAPRTFLVTLCYYRQLRATARWQVLARAGDRCGPERRLASVRVSRGREVRVPPAGPNEVVFARLHLHRPFFTRVADALFKPTSTPKIVLDGRPFRFRPTTAGDPQVLRVPRSAGYAPAFGGKLRTNRFRLATWPWSYRVDFYAISLASRG
jgi:hypothetical protein